MDDFLAALGLVFALEGLLLAAFPGMMRNAMRDAAERPEGWLRQAGLVSALVGIGLLFLVRQVF